MTDINHLTNLEEFDIFNRKCDMCDEDIGNLNLKNKYVLRHNECEL